MQKEEVQQLQQQILTLSEKLYLSNASKQINNVISMLEAITSKLMDTTISKDDTEYFNIINENILKSIETKDWIFTGDILRYELTNFVKEAFVCL